MKSLSELAKIAGLAIAGNRDLRVGGIRYANDATESDVAVAFKRQEIEQTRARAVITKPLIFSTDKTLMYCDYGGLLAAVAKIAPLFAADYGKPPNYRSTGSGCFFGDFVRIGLNTYISPGTVIGDDVTIGKEVLIEPHVSIGSHTIIGDSCIIRAGARIGAASFLHYEEQGTVKVFAGIGKTILGNGVTVGYNSVIQRGTLGDTVIADHVLIGNLVIIAHDVRIQESSRIVCQSGIAGRADIGSHVKILGQSGIVENISLGDYSTVMAKSVATKNVGCGEVISGAYGRSHKEELRTQALLRKQVEEE